MIENKLERIKAVNKNLCEIFSRSIASRLMALLLSMRSKILGRIVNSESAMNRSRIELANKKIKKPGDNKVSK